MKKLLLLIIITLSLFYSCNSGCDGMGDGYDKTYISTHIVFKDSTNSFISFEYPLQKVKYYLDTTHSQVGTIINWNKEIKLLKGEKPVSSIIIQHKKGIDTIHFEFIRSKPKYDVDACDELAINFNYYGPFIKSYTFNSVYFHEGTLILE